MRAMMAATLPPPLPRPRRRRRTGRPDSSARLRVCAKLECSRLSRPGCARRVAPRVLCASVRRMCASRRTSSLGQAERRRAFVVAGSALCCAVHTRAQRSGGGRDDANSAGGASEWHRLIACGDVVTDDEVKALTPDRGSRSCAGAPATHRHSVPAHPLTGVEGHPVSCGKSDLVFVHFFLGCSRRDWRCSSRPPPRPAFPPRRSRERSLFINANSASTPSRTLTSVRLEQQRRRTPTRAPRRRRRRLPRLERRRTPRAAAAATATATAIPGPLHKRERTRSCSTLFLCGRYFSRW